MFGHIAQKRAAHGEQLIRLTLDHVREGRENKPRLTAPAAALSRYGASAR